MSWSPHMREHNPPPACFSELLNYFSSNRYDTRGAKSVGMKTVYVYRWTDDINEDQAAVRQENDAYLEGMDGLAETVTRLGSI